MLRAYTRKKPLYAPSVREVLEREFGGGFLRELRSPVETEEEEERLLRVVAGCLDGMKGAAGLEGDESVEEGLDRKCGMLEEGKDGRKQREWVAKVRLAAQTHGEKEEHIAKWLECNISREMHKAVGGRKTFKSGKGVVGKILDKIANEIKENEHTEHLFGGREAKRGGRVRRMVEE